MENSIIQQLQNLPEPVDSKFKENDTLSRFEEANKKFEELVAKGLLKERGNNLLSIDKAHLINRVSFNSNF